MILEKLSNWANKWLITFNALKTEVMLISNVFHDYNFEFKLNNSSLEIVDVHKHLGVYISSDNKWNKHIESIIASASKQIAYLRKLKYILPEETLNKLYCTYIRPLLEYASEVWDGCTITDSNRLEQVQLTAARIVTGLPTFSSLCSLYSETGWETLAERRRNKKLTLLHKIINNKAPVYLQDLLPDTVGATSSYDLRNSANFEVPFTRLCSFETSFFPSTLKLWNELDLCIRSIPSTSQFKSSVRNLPPKPLNYLSAGERKFNIILTRLRHRSSSLKSDLFNINIIDNRNCSCGAEVENAEHYFFECPLYDVERDRLFRSLPQNYNITFDFIVNGCATLSYESNKYNIISVLKFIRDSRRFE